MKTFKKKSKIFRCEKGQGLIEFFLFLPFILMMYSIMLSLATAINSSINQQKVTRGYFYYKMQNNSTAPGPRRNGVAPEQSWQRYSMHINIWGEDFLKGSDSPKATCFSFKVPLGKSEKDSCDESYSKTTTQYIRIATAYGICGATYENQNQKIMRYLYHPSISPLGVIDRFACTIE